MKKFRSFVVMAILISTLTACSGSSQSNDSAAVAPEPSPTEEAINSEAKRIIQLKVAAYIDYNCTPKFVTDVTDFGDGVTTRIKNMDVYNLEILGIEQYGAAQEDKYFLVNDPADSTYGNFATRTVYLASLYHWYLSDVYSYAYDIYATEMKSVRKDYTRFKSIADGAGRKICSIAKQNFGTENLSASDVTKVQAVYDELEANWVGFNTWYEGITAMKETISNNIDASIKEMNTPTCNEYPTADGKYVVVKCSLP